MRMLNKMVASIITIDSSIGLIKGLDSFYIFEIEYRNRHTIKEGAIQNL